MAKHAKPNLTSTLSRNGARGAAAAAMVSVGFLATAPAALAGDGDDHGHDKKHGAHHESNDIDSHESQGIVNVADNDVLVPVQVCDNYVPVNVLGIQVPIEEVEVTPAVPILTEGDTEADSSESCQQAAGIAEESELHSSGGEGHAPAAGSNELAADTDAADQGAGGEGLGGVHGLVTENGAGSPAAALAPASADRSTGDVVGPVSQQHAPEQVTAPAGDLGTENTPGAAQAAGLAPGGL